MSEESHRPWKATGLALAGVAVLALGIHYGLHSNFFWSHLILALAVFALGFLTRHFTTIEARLLDGIAALAFGMTLVAISASYSLYAICAALLVAAVAVTATRLVR